MTDLPLPLQPAKSRLAIFRASRAGRALSEPVTLIGAILVALHLFLALFAPLLSPHSIGELVGTPMQTPSFEFWLGTDQIGRDYFSRSLQAVRWRCWCPAAVC
jgi:peptide/nickel transport system permease protein